MPMLTKPRINRPFPWLWNLRRSVTSSTDLISPPHVRRWRLTPVCRWSSKVSWSSRLWQEHSNMEEGVLSDLLDLLLHKRVNSSSNYQQFYSIKTMKKYSKYCKCIHFISESLLTQCQCIVTSSTEKKIWFSQIDFSCFFLSCVVLSWPGSCNQSWQQDGKWVISYFVLSFLSWLYRTKVCW